MSDECGDDRARFLASPSRMSDALASFLASPSPPNSSEEEDDDTNNERGDDRAKIDEQMRRDALARFLASPSPSVSSEEESSRHTESEADASTQELPFAAEASTKAPGDLHFNDEPGGRLQDDTPDDEASPDTAFEEHDGWPWPWYGVDPPCRRCELEKDFARQGPLWQGKIHCFETWGGEYPTVAEYHDLECRCSDARRVLSREGDPTGWMCGICHEGRNCCRCSARQQCDALELAAFRELCGDLSPSPQQEDAWPWPHTHVSAANGCYH